MRLVFLWRDQMRTLTAKNMNAFAAAVVAQIEAMLGTANTWAARDHSDDGSHNVISLNIQSEPLAVAGQLRFYYDGADLKVVFPNGTTGTVTIV